MKAEDAPRTVAHILNVYLRAASVQDESFLAFAHRVDVEAFRAVARLEAAE